MNSTPHEKRRAFEGVKKLVHSKKDGTHTKSEAETVTGYALSLYSYEAMNAKEGLIGG